MVVIASFKMETDMLESAVVAVVGAGGEGRERRKRKGLEKEGGLECPVVRGPTYVSHTCCRRGSSNNSLARSPIILPRINAHAPTPARR